MHRTKKKKLVRLLIKCETQLKENFNATLAILDAFNSHLLGISLIYLYIYRFYIEIKCKYKNASHMDFSLRF